MKKVRFCKKLILILMVVIIGAMHWNTAMAFDIVTVTSKVSTNSDRAVIGDKGFTSYTQNGRYEQTSRRLLNETGLLVEGLVNGGEVEYPLDYKEYSFVKKQEYLLGEIGFNIIADDYYDIETAAYTIIFEGYMESVYGNDVKGLVDNNSVSSLEIMLANELTYDEIMDTYISKWQPMEPTIKRVPIVNGRLDEASVDLVTVPVRDGTTASCEKNTAIAWAMLVHDKEFEKYGAKADIFYLTYDVSGYRTYEEQVDLFGKYGRVRAAFPGTSNHGWGLALDLSTANYIRGLVAYDQETLAEFETMMEAYGFKPLKHENGTYWEEWHWDYMLE